MRRKQPLMALIVIAGGVGCKPDYVEPDQTDPTEDGYGDTGGSTGDTESSNPDACFAKEAPAEAVRWQCEGFAEAALHFTLSEDAEIPDAVPDDWREYIQGIIDYGRLDWYELFGPVNGETYDEPGIDACCLPGIGGADVQEASDETGEPPPGEEPWVPQPAMACAEDCADQACRQAIREIRTQAEMIPGIVDVSGASLRDQLIEISNFLATGQPCFDAMTADGASEGGGGWQISGTVVLPTPDGRWPAFAEVSVRGECTIYDWYMPEQGEPDTCTGINDNNGEDPFGSGGPGGSGFGGFDTFAPVRGKLDLDGPTILGIHAAGSAPILGLGDACPRGECSRVDAWISAETLELERMVLLAPSSMSWAQDGMRLTIDGMHAIIEHPRSIPLVAAGDERRFELPAGELEVMLAGRVQGVPLTVTVPNATPLTGSVIALPDGSHAVSFAPFTLEYRDEYGTWTMHVTLGELIAVEHSPRAVFTTHESTKGIWFDASASFDPDGDALAFQWLLGGEVVGEGPQLTIGTSSILPLTLRVTDPAGRSSWSYDADLGGR